VKQGDVLSGWILAICVLVWTRLRSALESAETSLKHAESDLQRDTKLHAERILPTMKFEQSKTTVELARSKSAGRAGGDRSRSEPVLRRSLAPQDGMIVDRLAEPGDIAQPGVPLLVLYDPQSLRLEAPVMENLAVKLKVGELLTVHIDALERDVEAGGRDCAAGGSGQPVVSGQSRLDGRRGAVRGHVRPTADPQRRAPSSVSAHRGDSDLGQLQFVDVVRADGRDARAPVHHDGRFGSPEHVEVLSGLGSGRTAWCCTRGNRTSIGIIRLL
jgi:hypothetical protein